MLSPGVVMSHAHFEPLHAHLCSDLRSRQNWRHFNPDATQCDYLFVKCFIKLATKMAARPISADRFGTWLGDVMLDAQNGACGRSRSWNCRIFRCITADLETDRIWKSLVYTTALSSWNYRCEGKPHVFFGYLILKHESLCPRNRRPGAFSPLSGDLLQRIRKRALPKSTVPKSSLLKHISVLTVRWLISHEDAFLLYCALVMHGKVR